jgi:hypothetical protein
MNVSCKMFGLGGLILSCALAVSACGGDGGKGGSGGSGSGGSGAGGTGGGGSSTFQTSVPANVEIGQLTPAQQQTLCKDFDAYFSNLLTKAQNCRIVGFTAAAVSAAFNDAASDAELRTECQKAVTDCQAAPEDTNTTCDPATAACHATVAEFTSCLNDVGAATKAELAVIPDCSSLTRATLQSTDSSSGGSDVTSPACDTVMTKCPEINTDPSSSNNP